MQVAWFAGFAIAAEKEQPVMDDQRFKCFAKKRFQ